MPVLILNKSYGGVPLKTIGYILGIIHSVFLVKVTALHLVFLILKLIELYEHEGARPLIPIQSIALVIFVVHWLLAFTFNIFLFVGLSMNKTGYLKPFLIYSLVFLVFIINYFIISTGNLVTMINIKANNVYGNIDMSLSDILETVAMVGTFLVILLQVFLLVTVRSLYYHMTETKSRSRGEAEVFVM